MVVRVVDSGIPLLTKVNIAIMSRHYGTEEALNLILDDGEADSDDDFAEPMCPGSDEEFEFNTDDQDFSVDNRYIMD